MAKKIGGAVIGYGGMGNFHSKKYQEVAGFELIGVYDIDPARNELAESRGIHAYATREELLADDRIDIVTIATPNDVHKEIAIAAMAAGKNVISEKPVAMNSGELEEMIAAAEKYGKLFTVHQNRRWDNDYLVVKKLYDDNVLGNIHRIESRVHGSRGIPGGWRQEPEHGGGMVLDWGVHLLDQMLTMMNGRKMLSVYATLTHVTNDTCDDGFTATVKFDGDLVWVVEVLTNNFIELPLWYVLGENGSTVINDWDLKGKTVMIQDWQKYEVAPIQAGAGLTRTMAPRTDDTIKKFPIKKIKADWSEYYKNIGAALRGEASAIVTHDQQRRLVKLMEAIFESARTNTVVNF